MMIEGLKRKLQQAIQEAIDKFEAGQQDPHFLVVGATGVGKSALINRVFRENLHAVGPIRSTTRDFSMRKYAVSGKAAILITDSPGYGEVGHDEEYSRQIVQASRESHVIILVLKADEKGYQRDLDMLTSVFGNREFDREKPLLIALNQIDKLPPVREWKPPYDVAGPPVASDGEKVRNIKDKLALVREQFRTIGGRLAPLVDPVMAASEPSAGQPFGIDEFREHLFETLPKVAKLKYARAARIAENASKELMEKLDRMADELIAGNAVAAAAAVLANPFPVSDWLFLAPIQIGMVVELGAVYGRTIDKEMAKEVVLTLGAGFAARTIFQFALSLIPGFKNIIGPPFASAATYGIGAAAKRYFKIGQVPTEQEFRRVVEAELNRQNVE